MVRCAIIVTPSTTFLGTAGLPVVGPSIEGNCNNLYWVPEDLRFCFFSMGVCDVAPKFELPYQQGHGLKKRVDY